jgi:hypothetical protein
MIRIALITAAALSLANFSCSSNSGTETEIVENTVVHAAVPPCEPTSKQIEFENVSFSYYPCVLGDVTANRVDEFRLPRPVDEYKPDGVAPEHIRFEFGKGPKYWEPFVEIYPIERFPEMYTVDKRMVKDIVQEIRDLHNVIKNPTLRFHGEIPYLPYMDAHQEMQAKVKAASFNGGTGIYFVTYIDTETILINNDHLRYIFEGISSDGKNYVLGEIPISLKYLDDITENVDSSSLEGFTYDDLMEILRTDEKDRKNPKYRSLVKRYNAYLSAVTSRIETTKPDEFNPTLAKLEELIATLRINN